MEPYRPYLDEIVLDIVDRGENFLELGSSIKSQLLGIATVDVLFDKGKSPLMVGLQQTTASLAKCYEGTARKIVYPQMKNFDRQTRYYRIENDNLIFAAEDKKDYGQQDTGEDENLPF
jgi:CRISPR-associated protein Cas1